jgi:putative redox protein
LIEAHALWTDRDRFLAEASSGHALVVDAGSEKSANSPVELVLIALCACTTSIDVRAVAERSEEFPKIFTSIKVVYRIAGKVAHTSVEHAVSLSEEKYCSVSAMLEKVAKIESVIEYAE